MSALLNASKMSVRSRGLISSSSLVIAAVACAASMAPLDAASAQSAPRAQGGGTDIEELVVTARLREESVQDVPVTVAVESGESLRVRGIERLDALSQSIPNVLVAEGVVSEKLKIRGISGGDNTGFEQPVGQVIDGFFYNRSRLIRLPFLDVARVEVLKGPQGALIGKNTTAGVISITSSRPTDKLEAFGQATYETYPDAGDGYIFEGAVSGPLTDSLKGRLALRRRTGGGFLQNPAAGIDMPDSDDWVGRGMLDWAPSESLDISLQWTHADLYREGSTRILAYCGPQFLAIMRANATVPFSCGAPGSLASIKQPVNGVGNFDYTDTQINLVGVTANLALGGGHTLTWLTGYADYVTDDWTGGDRTEFEAINQQLGEDYSQWSQEVRLLSPTGGRFEYLAGLFYQHRELDTVFAQHFNLPRSPFPVPAPFRIPSSNVSLASEQGDSYAAFGSLTWNATEKFAVTFDARYTLENKDASQMAFVTPVYSLSSAARTRTLIPAVSASREETDFSPGLSVQWKPRDGVMIYGSARKGFKGGGFNLSRVQPTDAFQFKEEKVTAFEVGAKSTLFDGALRLNVSVFDQDFTDLQVSALDNSGGVPILTTTNAAGVRSQGVEVQATWNPIPKLILSTALGYNRAVYEGFNNASCFRGQTVAQGCVNGQQSLDGRQVEETPKFKGNVDAQYTWGLTSSLDLTAFGRASYTGDYYVTQDGDPLSGSGTLGPKQKNYWLLESRVTLSNPDAKWDLSLIGRNLTDEILDQGGSRIPGVLPDARQPRATPGRSFLLQATLRY